MAHAYVVKRSYFGNRVQTWMTLKAELVSYQSSWIWKSLVELLDNCTSHIFPRAHYRDLRKFPTLKLDFPLLGSVPEVILFHICCRIYNSDHSGS
jgi:hypothetical protein